MATIAADALTGRSVAQQHRNPGGLADRSPGVSFDSAIDALMSIANDLDQGGRPSGKSSVARVLAQAAVAPTRPLQTQRSEERRVGKECVSKCRSRCAPDHIKKNKNQKDNTKNEHVKAMIRE